MDMLRAADPDLIRLKPEAAGVWLVDRQLLCNLVHHQVVSKEVVQTAVGSHNLNATTRALKMGGRPPSYSCLCSFRDHS